MLPRRRFRGASHVSQRCYLIRFIFQPVGLEGDRDFYLTSLPPSSSPPSPAFFSLHPALRGAWGELVKTQLAKIVLQFSKIRFVWMVVPGISDRGIECGASRNSDDVRSRQIVYIRSAVRLRKINTSLLTSGNSTPAPRAQRKLPTSPYIKIRIFMTYERNWN